MPRDVASTIKMELREKTLDHLKQVESNLIKFETVMHMQGFNKIIILGMDELGEKFNEMVMKTDIDVEYCIDYRLQNKEATSMQSPLDIKDNVDAIIVTDEFKIKRIVEDLYNKVSVPIVSLDSLIVEILNYPNVIEYKTPEQLGEKLKEKYNVYERRREECLYYILPKNNYIGKSNFDQIIPSSVAIIVNLYYIADAETYFERLNNVQKVIDIYIISSSDELCQLASAYVERVNRENIYVLKKENRGRDISALLVAAKDIIKKYKYICFTHDKKEKFSAARKDGEFWIENLWGNLFSSQEYIANVFSKFAEDDELGLLVPPEPIGMYQNAWYQPAWGSSFGETKKLAKKLNLKCNISQDKPPITLGTAFWCKREALLKLFDYNWEYTDFPSEPLAADGTISHAVERILAFVAQDSGYKTAIVMTDDYVSKMLSFLQPNIQNTFKFLKQTYNLENFHDTNWMYNHMNGIHDFFARYEKVYLYGAGKVGKHALNEIRARGEIPAGFIITKKDGTENIEELQVITLNELEKADDVGIIITVGKNLREAVMNELENIGFKDYAFYQDIIEGVNNFGEK